MADPFNSIPGVKATLNLLDLRALIQAKNAIALLPLGVGAAGSEGTIYTAKKWDADAAAFFGNSPIAQKVIEAWALQCSGLSLRVMPINEGLTTPATLDIALESVSTEENPSVTTAGTLVFSIDGTRYEFPIANGTTFTQIQTDFVAYVNTLTGVNATAGEKKFHVVIETEMKGSLANQISFQWLYADEKYSLPGGMKTLALDTYFAGGTQEVDFAEKMKMYYKHIRNNNVFFFTPYTELKDIKAIQDGLFTVYDDIVRANSIDFVPLMVINARKFASIDKAYEYRKALNLYGHAIAPLFDFYGDVITEHARIAFGVWAGMQAYRLNNSSNVPLENITTPKEFTENDLSTMLHNGLSVITADVDGNITLKRVLSTYKEQDESKPIDMLTSVAGAIYVVNGALSFAQALAAKRYLIVTANPGDNRITTGMIQNRFFSEMNKLFNVDDPVVDGMQVSDMACTRISEDSVGVSWSFKVIDGINFINLDMIQKIGIEE